ncbi:MAG TPA: sensor histidine kinase [Candidatus Baltobacteraceae bacterium]|nr:sensor histidine kinase [Candidatus Baltobacteraceae bacterium]
MRLRSLLSDPLRALVVLETVVMASSYALDVFIATMHVNKNPGDPKSLAIYSIEFIVAAVALASIPHRPNRRYVAIAIALCLVPVSVQSASGTLGPVVLLAVLAVRLTFAFGFFGTSIAWLLTFTSIMFMPVMKFVAAPTFKHGTDLMSYGILLLLFTGVLYGVVAMMWLYARQGAAAAAAAERTRIALDLHDSLGHLLTTLGVHLENADRLAPTDVDKARAYIARAGVLASELLSDVRETVAILHDSDLDQSPTLSSLLDRLRSDFASAHPVDLQWRVALETEPQGRSAHVIFRVLQEALTNVARHAHAHRVGVDVRGDKNAVSVSVKDDGRGFEESDAKGYGLLSMRTRVESVAGTLKIDSQNGAGTSVQATIPLESVL